MKHKNIYLIIAIFMLVNNIHLWSAERSSNLVSIDSIIDIKSNFAFQRQLNVIRAQNRGVYKNLLSYMIHSSDEKGQVNSAEIQEAITLALASLKPNPSTGLPTKILADDIINKTYFNDELNNLRTNAPQAYQHVIQEIEDNKDYLELINSSDAQRIIQEATQRLGQMPQPAQRPGSTSTATRQTAQAPIAPAQLSGKLEYSLNLIYLHRFDRNPSEVLNQFPENEQKILLQAIKQRKLLEDSPYGYPATQALMPLTYQPAGTSAPSYKPTEQFTKEEQQMMNKYKEAGNSRGAMGLADQMKNMSNEKRIELLRKFQKEFGVGVEEGIAFELIGHLRGPDKKEFIELYKKNFGRLGNW